MLEHLKKEFQFKYLSLSYKNLKDDYDEDNLLTLFHDSFVSINKFFIKVFFSSFSFYLSIHLIESFIYLFLT